MKGCAVIVACAGLGICAGCRSVSEPTVRIPEPTVAARPDSGRPKRIPPRFRRLLNQALTNDLKRRTGTEGGYGWRMEFREPISQEQQLWLREYFRVRCAESFVGETALAVDQVGVSITSERSETTAYSATAIAYGLGDVSLDYNPYTREGTLSMKVANGDFATARRMIRDHIETIARDKNIILITGSAPPPGRYYLLQEKTLPGNVLEIGFRVE